jgi:chromosome partitioning protein
MLRPILNDYEYILIDCPPSLGMLTVNALVASDYIIVPLTGEFLPKKGVEGFLKQLQNLKETLGLEIEVAGFLLARFSPRKKMNEEVKSWLQENYADLLFRTFIHTDIKLATAQKNGMDIFSYAPNSVAAMDYENLANEFLSVIASKSNSQLEVAHSERGNY